MNTDSFFFSFLLFNIFADTTCSFESELIEKIIGDISNKLNREYFMVAHYPVGLESRMQNLSKLLNSDSSDVRMVGIVEDRA
jgi:hypothetical protein